jgi:glutathione synthase/RimK-type ligase-like ATP-grasp enzyme
VILIITHKEDFTVDFVIEKLNRQEIPYYRLNCEDIYTKPITSKSNSNFFFDIHGLTDFHSVWFRRTKIPDIESVTDEEKLFLLQDFNSFFDNLFQLINTKKWLSLPQNAYRAENKLLQLQTAEKLGFKLPNTLVSNDYSILEQFLLDNNNDVIIKPIRQGRIKTSDGFETIFTNRLNQTQIQNLRSFELTPCIFQEYIDKEYEIRVTIVGEKVFAAKIDSQSSNETKVDWRRVKSKFEKYLLPIDISSMCKGIVKDLGLSFGAIDLIKNKQGEYVFLEINPNGQWAWLEIENELKISDAIINFLTK